MDTTKPTIAPVITSLIAPSKAQEIARSRIIRYITVLAIFSEERDVHDDIPWDPFPYKTEYMELSKAGLILGTLATTVTSERHPKGTDIIALPGITVAGIAKLLELSEHVWKTSLLGQLLTSILQLFWLIAGVLLGCAGSFWFSSGATPGQ